METKRKALIPICLTVFTCSLLLTLSGCGSGLPPEQADAVAKLEAAGGKVVRSEDGTKVTYADFNEVRDVAGSIVHVKALPDVEKLNFTGTNIGDDELARLADLSELKELGFTRTKITDKGLAHLSDLPKLRVLTLNNCNISDEGLVHLQNLKTLKQLHLNETKVTDAGLEHLAVLEQLEALMLHGTAVTPAAAAAFREKRPDTMVVTSEGESGADDESDGQ